MAHVSQVLKKSLALSKCRIPYLEDMPGTAFSSSSSLQKLGGEASSAVSEGIEMRLQSAQRLSLDGYRIFLNFGLGSSSSGDSSMIADVVMRVEGLTMPNVD